jgi:hypothetical protein
MPGTRKATPVSGLPPGGRGLLAVDTSGLSRPRIERKKPRIDSISLCAVRHNFPFQFLLSDGFKQHFRRDLGTVVCYMEKVLFQIDIER